MKKKVLHSFVIVISILLMFGCSEVGPENNEIDLVLMSEAFKDLYGLPGMRSIVVAREQTIVAEEYYNSSNSEASNQFDPRSVTKSIMATLIGIAIDKGIIKNVNQTLGEFIGGFVELDSMRSNITIHQLLTMSSGFDWKEIDDETNPSMFYEFVYSPDQLLYILELPFVYTPGTTFDYNSGGSHLLSVILSEASGLSTSEFARIHLLEPLEIGERFWYEDNRGYNYGAAGLCIGPYDMIKIGNMYLRKGVYNGTRIVSEEWIEEVTTNHISTNNTLPFFPDYGYQWWIGSKDGHSYYCAVGYGGQFIMVVPDLELAVTATCDFRTTTEIASSNWNTIITTIVNKVIPAAY